MTATVSKRHNYLIDPIWTCQGRRSGAGAGTGKAGWNPLSGIGADARDAFKTRNIFRILSRDRGPYRQST